MSRYPGLIASLAMIASLAGCGPPPGEVYPLPLADAKARVATTEVPTFIFGSAAVDVQAMTQGDTVVLWPITTKGSELFRFVATLTPVDAAHTRVDVAFVPAPAGSGAAGEKVAERLKANADIAELYRKAMVEAVDATIEHRDFAFGAIAPAMTLAAIGHLGEDFKAEEERHGKQVKSNLERAYADAGVEY